jgi:hypothetical protein
MTMAHQKTLPMVSPIYLTKVYDPKSVSPISPLLGQSGLERQTNRSSRSPVADPRSSKEIMFETMEFAVSTKINTYQYTMN